MHHYVYVIHNDTTGEYYIGVRTSKQDPHADPYMGSSTNAALRAEMQSGYPWQKFVVGTYHTRGEANLAESEMIKAHLHNGLCINGGIGWYLSDAAEAKRKVAQQAALARPDVREKRLTAVRTVLSSPETKEKCRTAARAAHARPEVKEKRALMYCDPLVRAKRSAALKAAHARPEVKEKHRAALKLSWQRRRELTH